MTLGRKLAVRIGALIVGLVLVAGAALWGLIGLSDHYTATFNDYEDLQTTYRIGYHVAMARSLLNASGSDVRLVRSQITAAQVMTVELHDNLKASSNTDNVYQQEKLEYVDAIRNDLHTVDAALQNMVTPDSSRRAVQELTAINTALGRVAKLAQSTNQHIVANHAAASKRLWTTIAMLAGLALAVIAAAVVVGVSQYQSVMHPLRRLTNSVGHLASGRFDERLHVIGDREFIDLAHDFNQMAAQLQEFYQQLENKVASTSRELVRSERLASVGYLAAGVAHEINNPLSIIAGYAEAQLQRKRVETPLNPQVEQSLHVIRDEAFRCKQIIQKLLLLAQPSGGTREIVSLSQVAHDVASMVRGLPQFHDRKLSLLFSEHDPLHVLANTTEMKQVLLNLVLNALDAVEPGVGHVRLTGVTRGEIVELVVRDNGRGMAPQTLERVFEPFFTDAPRRAGKGTGLGLWMTHTILATHNGRIRGSSEGPGRGSVFTIEMPLAITLGANR